MPLETHDDASFDQSIDSAHESSRIFCLKFLTTSINSIFQSPATPSSAHSLLSTSPLLPLLRDNLPRCVLLPISSQILCSSLSPQTLGEACNLLRSLFSPTPLLRLLKLQFEHLFNSYFRYFF